MFPCIFFHVVKIPILPLVVSSTVGMNIRPMLLIYFRDVSRFNGAVNVKPNLDDDIHTLLNAGSVSTLQIMRLKIARGFNSNRFSVGERGQIFGCDNCS